jgi:hypothetical protein
MTIRLGNGMPALDVMQDGAILFSRFDVLGIQFCLELAGLCI